MNAALIPFRGAALIGAAALAFIATPAAAQDSGGGGSVVMVGLGPQVYPKYLGSDEYALYPYIIGGFRREGSPLDFSAPGCPSLIDLCTVNEPREIRALHDDPRV